MSWRLVEVRDQRVEFVVRLSRGECMSSLCREFGITRPTGYLWQKRFGGRGMAGMEESSRRPHASPRRTAYAIEARIVALRRQRPDWGARKLAVLLEREGVRLPVITVHRVLVRHRLAGPGTTPAGYGTLRARGPEPALADGLQGAEGSQRGHRSLVRAG